MTNGIGHNSMATRERLLADIQKNVEDLHGGSTNIIELRQALAKNYDDLVELNDGDEAAALADLKYHKAFDVDVTPRSELTAMRWILRGGLKMTGGSVKEKSNELMDLWKTGRFKKCLTANSFQRALMSAEKTRIIKLWKDHPDRDPTDDELKIEIAGNAHLDWFQEDTVIGWIDQWEERQTEAYRNRQLLKKTVNAALDAGMAIKDLPDSLQRDYKAALAAERAARKDAEDRKAEADRQAAIKKEDPRERKARLDAEAAERYKDVDPEKVGELGAEEI